MLTRFHREESTAGEADQVESPSGAPASEVGASSDPTTVEVLADSTSLDGRQEEEAESSAKPVEFHLYDDPAEKEALVQRLKAAAAAAAELPATEEQASEVLETTSDIQQSPEDEPVEGITSSPG